MLHARLTLLAAALVALLVAAGPVRAHLRAASLLTQLAGQPAPALLPGPHPLVESELELPGPAGPVRARLYKPADLERAPGLVVAHGVHRLGITDPRLQGFARALAGAGAVVLTPEIKPLTEYRVDAAGVEVIRAAAEALAARPEVSAPRVGLVGMSFAGGLALLAAADPRTAARVGLVVAIGAHDDLARVSRFFATEQVEPPDGPAHPAEAHEYGALVLAYTHLEDFFPAGDVPAAREILRRYLWEEKAQARAQEAGLSAAGRARMDALIDARATLRPELSACVARHAQEMGVASPHGHLEGLQAPVFLLHGAGDTVIPPAETAWLARDVPPSALRAVLVTPLLSHVSLEGQPPLGERWRAVHFMAGVLEAAEAASRR